MFKPLSIFTYYWNNKRRVVPLIIIIAISILAISATASILDAVYGDMRNRMVEFYRNYYTVFLPTRDPNEYKSLKSDIEKINNIESLLDGQIQSTKVTTIAGSMNTRLAFIDKESIEVFLKNQNWNLIEGELPKVNDEILLTSVTAKNKGLKVGDEFGNELDKSEYLTGKFKVSGIVDAGSIFGGVGDISYYEKISKISVKTIFVKPREGYSDYVTDKINELIEKYPDLTMATAKSQDQVVKNDFKMMRIVLWIVNIIIAFAVAISIALVSYIIFNQRANEFGLLEAIGYPKSYIIVKTISEVVGMTIIGWILGLLFTEFIYTQINNQLLTPKGLTELTVLTQQSTLSSLMIPAIVLVFSIVTVLQLLLSMDPISIIEKRD